MMKLLLVDDEPLARLRLASLVAQCEVVAARVQAQAGNAQEALQALAQQRFDAVLLDIQMPGQTGLALAQGLRQLPEPPAVIFVTAHTQHALRAFELDAVDYLTKPVRLERLGAALQKVQRLKQAQVQPQVQPQARAVEPQPLTLSASFTPPMAAQAQAPTNALDPSASLLIQERGQVLRLALTQVVCVKAELKYLTVYTAQQRYLMDGSLADLEQRFAGHWLRVHRSALAARWALRALQRRVDPQLGELWELQLAGLEERLLVSRRQLPLVRDALLSLSSQ